MKMILAILGMTHVLLFILKNQLVVNYLGLISLLDNILIMAGTSLQFNMPKASSLCCAKIPFFANCHSNLSFCDNIFLKSFLKFV